MIVYNWQRSKSLLCFRNPFQYKKPLNGLTFDVQVRYLIRHRLIFIIHFQVDSFLIEEGGSLASSEPEPEFLLSRAPPHSPEPEYQQQGAGVDQETQARLEALLEAAGISRLSGESKQLADPDILRRLTSSVR